MYSKVRILALDRNVGLSAAGVEVQRILYAHFTEMSGTKKMSTSSPWTRKTKDLNERFLRLSHWLHTP